MERAGARTHAHTYSQTASLHKDSVLSESMFLCVKRKGLSNSPLAISYSPLHKPLSSIQPVPIVWRSE